MSSHIALSLLTGLSMLSLVSFTPGCASSLGGPEAKTMALLAKLPAGVDGFAVIDVKRTFSDGQLDALLERAASAGLNTHIPTWVRAANHVVVLSNWTAGPKNVPDCDAAADHVLALMKKKMGAGASTERLEEMRPDFVGMCVAMPKMAPCIMSLKDIENMMSCVQKGGANAFPFAAIVTGDFKASDIINDFNRSPAGRPEGGLDLVAGGRAVTALANNIVVVGDTKTVTAVKAAWEGKAERLGADSGVMKLLSNVDKGAAIVAAAQRLTELPKRLPMEAAALSVTLDGKSDLAYWMQADDAMLTRVEDGMTKFKLAMAVVMVAQVGPLFEGMEPETAKRVVAAAKSFGETVKGKRVGGGLAITAEMRGTIVEYMAIAAPILTTAFVKYRRRAKTAEAIEGIEKIYKGAAAYFMTPRASADGLTVLPCEFPKSVVCTPIAKPCDKYPAATEGTWADPSWAALSFEMTDSHYFQYCFESNGTGSNAKFTVTAHGDLDCDGKLSTFSRSARGIDAGNGECTIKSGGQFYKKDETE